MKLIVLTLFAFLLTLSVISAAPGDKDISYENYQLLFNKLFADHPSLMSMGQVFYDNYGGIGGIDKAIDLMRYVDESGKDQNHH